MSVRGTAIKLVLLMPPGRHQRPAGRPALSGFGLRLSTIAINEKVRAKQKNPQGEHEKAPLQMVTSQQKQQC